MSRPLLASEVHPCVWMSAGVLRYRLCSRDFDCETCPLDSALRGSAPVQAGDERHAENRVAFPADRLYAAGHTWLRARLPGREVVWRLGLDAFAAAMVADTRTVSWDGTPRFVQAGDGVCTLDVGLGFLEVRSPVRARILGYNEVLSLHPECVVADPYGRGWLAEIAPMDARDLEALLTPADARRAAIRDLRSFRHTVALSLLHEPDEDASEASRDLGVPDLRRLLGGDHYVEFLGELVH